MSYIKSIMDNPGDFDAMTIARADYAGQTANIPFTPLFSVPASEATGTFEIRGYASVTTPATTSSTLPAFYVGWTDADSGGAMTTTVGVTETGNALTTFAQGQAIINAAPGTEIQVATVGYASIGATPMAYAAHVVLQKV